MTGRQGHQRAPSSCQTGVTLNRLMVAPTDVSASATGAPTTFPMIAATIAAKRPQSGPARPVRVPTRDVGDTSMWQLPVTDGPTERIARSLVV